MTKKGYDRENLFGDIIHYDEKGRRIGESRRGILGGYTDFDEKGHEIGRTEEDLLGGGFTHYDKNGRKLGRTEERDGGDYTHYDAKGRHTGYTRRSVIDADPDRLENTASVYRRSYDPPRILDDGPPGQTDRGGPEEAPCGPASAPPDASPAARETARNARTEKRAVCLVLLGTVLLFLLLVGFIGYSSSAWPEQVTLGMIRNAAKGLDGCVTELEEYAALYLTGGAVPAAQEIDELRDRLTSEGRIMSIVEKDQEKHPPALRYRRAWRIMDAARERMIRITGVLAKWDADGDGTYSDEETLRVNDSLRELLPELEKDLDRLKTELDRQAQKK